MTASRPTWRDGRIRVVSKDSPRLSQLIRDFEAQKVCYLLQPTVPFCDVSLPPMTHPAFFLAKLQFTVMAPISEIFSGSTLLDATSSELQKLQFFIFLSIYSKIFMGRWKNRRAVGVRLVERSGKQLSLIHHPYQLMIPNLETSWSLLLNPWISFSCPTGFDGVIERWNYTIYTVQLADRRQLSWQTLILIYYLYVLYDSI
jgi:hypothetical protein